MPVQYPTASQTLQIVLLMVTRAWGAGMIMGSERLGFLYIYIHIYERWSSYNIAKVLMS